MAYTTINKSTEYFNTLLYTGNGATSTAGTLARTISGVGFQPDFTWLKERTSVSGGYGSNGLHDAVRGASKWIGSNSTNAQTDVTTNFGNGGLGSFTSDGFGIHSGTAGSTDNYNVNTGNYVSWNWKANGSGSSNTDGSITSTVSANTTSGFSIVKYTNPSSGSPFTVGHGLGVAPKMIMTKRLDATQTWGVWHTGIGFGKYLRLDSTAVEASANLVTATSNTTFSSYYDHHDAGAEIIAYCFAEKTGFSKFGSYTGNGSTDGTFIYTGFKPAFVIIKKATGSGDGWYIIDNKRIGYNEANYASIAQGSSTEETGTNRINLLSNGFKCRQNNTAINNLDSTYIYMAFAEAPLVGSNNVPCTAR